MGPLGIPDEGGHMYRTWLVSEGICTGVPAVGVAMDPRDLDHRFLWSSLPPGSTGRDVLAKVDDAHGLPLPMVSLFFAVNLYSCLPYLPAGAAFRFGRFFTDAPFSLMYLGRFVNLLFYLLMVVAAMQLLPQFQLPLAVLALMPMSMHQAASLSADAVTIAVSFVLTAFIVRLAVSADPAPLTRSDYLLLLLGTVVAGLCKSSAGLLFLLLLVPGAKFPDRRTRWLAIAGYIALGFGIAAAWQVINRPNGEVHATLKAAAGIFPAENATMILDRPVIFLNGVIRTVRTYDEEYLEEFVGKLGPLSIRLPVWIPWVYLGLLLVLAVVYRAGPRLSIGQRLLLLGILLLNVGSLFAVVWTTELPRAALAAEFPAGRGVISGVQGRYLIPLAPLLLLAVSGIVRFRDSGRGPSRWVFLPVLALVAIVNAVALDLVWNRYQAHSSTFPNRIRMALHLQFSRTPETAALRYDNLVIASRDPGSLPFLISEGVKHPVPSLASVISRGYRWPEDVLLVSDPEIAAIPPGPPLPPPPGGYEGRLVRRPGDSAEDAKVYLVRDGRKHWVWDGHWITAHGFRWPDDVNFISAAELAQFPEGDPIQ
jgi:hypothetical protein